MRKIFLLFFGFVFLIACDSKAVYDRYESLPGEWHKDSVVTFTYKNTDTTEVYNLFINIRNNNDYSFSNLYLITEMNFPKGKVVVDTLEYMMAYPNGKWMGVGFTDVKISKLWYKENVRFTELGIYSLSIRQAMRKNGKIDGLEKLEGITEVGLRIEKSEDAQKATTLSGKSSEE